MLASRSRGGPLASSDEARPHDGMANYADGARTPRTLTEREQRALLKVTGEHRAGYRDHVLYAMALGTGLREHELIALDVGDVFRDGRNPSTNGRPCRRKAGMG